MPELSSRSSRFFQFSLVISSLCLAAVLRLGNYGFFTADLTGHFNFIDTDCYYQLRRLVYFIENFPRTLTFDPLADWPNGSMVDWPDGFVYLLGIPLKILGVDDFRSLELSVCFLMVALGLATVFMIYVLAQRILKDRVLSLLVLFFASMNYLLIRFSCLGEVDHHILEAIFPIWILWLGMRAFQDGSKGAAVMLGLSMTLFLWVSSSSLFAIATFFVVYAFVLARTNDSSRYGLMLAAFVLSLLPLVIYHQQSFGSLKLLTHPSMFHFIFVLALATVAFLISRYRRRALYILIGSAVLFGFGYALKSPAVLMEPLYWAIDYVFGRSGPLQSVSEASPIFMNFEEFNLNFMHSNFGYFVYLLPLVWIFVFFLRRFSDDEKILLLSLALLAIPAVFQKRFCQLMIGLFLIYLGWCLKLAYIYLRDKKLRLAPAVTMLWMGFSILPSLKYGFYPEGSPRDRVDHGIAHFFLEQVPTSKEDVWQRLALKQKVDEGLYINPNVGHMMQYLTGLGVISNSFYHWPGFELDFRIRQAQSDQEFRELLAKNRIRYLIFVDDFKFLEFQYDLRHLSKDKILKQQMMNGSMATIFQMNELLNYAWVRWLVAEGEIDHFSQLFKINFLEDYYYRNATAYRFDGP